MFKDVAQLHNAPSCGVLVSPDVVDWSAGNLLSVLDKMNPNKGLGPDQLPVSVWAAGGLPIAQHIAHLGALVCRQCAWPTTLRGSRIVDLWKKAKAIA